ncbi:MULTISPECIES: hypothetical protein [unclassified Nocardia]|uniref:hypothetical protein n=1 Tax=unclassified Nocardia TaxID=2637762 RepID=UPI00342FCC2A
MPDDYVTEGRKVTTPGQQIGPVATGYTGMLGDGFDSLIALGYLELGPNSSEFGHHTATGVAAGFPQPDIDSRQLHAGSWGEDRGQLLE